MTDTKAGWTTAAVLVGRLIFAGLFIMAASFKLMYIDGTAAYIASAGFPLPKLLAWLAALFELAPETIEVGHEARLRTAGVVRRRAVWICLRLPSGCWGVLGCRAAGWPTGGRLAGCRW